jgi:hypothetical protein
MRKTIIEHLYAEYIPKFFKIKDPITPLTYITFSGRIGGKHRARTFIFGLKNFSVPQQRMLREV